MQIKHFHPATEPSASRVAVCYTGQLRSASTPQVLHEPHKSNLTAAQSLRQHVLRWLPRHDVFGVFEAAPPRDVLSHVSRTIPMVHVELCDEEAASRALERSKLRCATSDHTSVPERLARSGFHQAWKLHRCWEALTLYERQQRHRYSYVARVRPDMHFYANALSGGLQSLAGVEHVCYRAVSRGRYCHQPCPRSNRPSEPDLITSDGAAIPFVNDMFYLARRESAEVLFEHVATVAFVVAHPEGDCSPCDLSDQRLAVGIEACRPQASPRVAEWFTAHNVSSYWACLPPFVARMMTHARRSVTAPLATSFNHEALLGLSLAASTKTFWRVRMLRVPGLLVRSSR